MFAPTQYQPTAQSLAQAPMSQADADRKRCMRDAWKAYRGDLPKPLKVSADQPDDNVLSNRCEPIVNKGVSFLFGQTLKIECGGEGIARTGYQRGAYSGDGKVTNLDPMGMQDFMDGLWGDDDERMTLLSQMAINGSVCGQVFVKLIPMQGLMKFPRIVVMDPQLVRIVTAPDDCSLALAYVIEYPSINDFQKRQVIARVDPDSLAGVAGEYDLDDSWTVTNYMRKGQAGSWFQVGSREVWPYPFAPIFTAQNLPNPNEPWGTPDLTPDLIEQNKVLNFILSNTSRIIKYHAHPKTYAIGLAASQINIGVDDLICLPSPDSKLANLEMHSDLSSSLKFIADIRSDMDEQSRVPAVALGRLVDLPKGNLSGVALQLLFQPLIEKTVQKQRLYGCLIRCISRAALVVAGLLSLEEYEDYPVQLHWQSLIPTDDLAAAQTAIVLQQAGVSRTSALQKLGYDPEEEARKQAVEGEQQPLQMPPLVGTPAGE